MRAWARRHWLSVLGSIPVLLGFLKFIKWLVGLGGDIDFIISRAQDPGWVADVMSAIIDPPVWLLALLIVSGFIMIFIDVRRSRSSNTKQDAPSTSEPDTTQNRQTEEARYKDLKGYFDTDFSNCLKANKSILIDLNFDRVFCHFSELRQFDVGGKALSVYIPSNKLTFPLCRLIAQKFRGIMEELSCIKLQPSYSGDFAIFKSSDLTGTGVIYIYHETDMTLEQLTELSRFYKTCNLRPVFRSTAYVTSRRMQDIHASIN